MIGIKVSNECIIVTSHWHFTRDIIISCHPEYSCDGQDACNFDVNLLIPKWCILWHQNDIMCYLDSLSNYEAERTCLFWRLGGALIISLHI